MKQYKLHLFSKKIAAIHFQILSNNIQFPLSLVIYTYIWLSLLLFKEIIKFGNPSGSFFNASIQTWYSNSFGKTLVLRDNEIVGFGNGFTVQSRYPDGGSDFLTSAIYVGYRQDLNSKSTLNTGIRFTNINKIYLSMERL